MTVTSFEDFRALAGESAFVPVVRETLADVSGVELTRYPPGLIAALRAGGASFVRLELAAGQGKDAGAALLALAGVMSVEARGGDGAYALYELQSEGDPRAAIGELCRAQGWAVRELSWQRPTLEKLFARIAFEIEPAREASEAAEGPA